MQLLSFAGLFPFLSLILSATAVGVDITLSMTPPNPNNVVNAAGENQGPIAGPWAGGNPIAAFGTTYQRCPNHPPGVCCKPRGPPPNVHVAMAAMFPQPRFRRVTMEGLLATDLGVAWVPRGHVQGCYGRPKETHWGGGTWVYDIPENDVEDQKLSGANWIKMPTELPPKETDNKWLSAEGLAGLVWGKGTSTWFSNDAPGSAGALLQAAAEKQLGGGGWPTRRKRNVNTNFRGVDRGVAFCKGPAWAQWADVIVLNGTEYRAEKVRSDIYHSGDGDTLDYTGA